VITPKKKISFRFVITKESERQNVIRRIQAINLSKPWVIAGEPEKKDRSSAQNRLSFLWYKQISEQSREDSTADVRNYCKFTFGCNLVIEQEHEKGNSEFTEFYETLINMMNYEQCIDAMEFIQVTSILKVKPFKNYLEQIEMYAAQKDCHLTHPSDLYWLAMGVKT